MGQHAGSTCCCCREPEQDQSGSARLDGGGLFGPKPLMEERTLHSFGAGWKGWCFSVESDGRKKALGSRRGWLQGRAS